MAVKVTESLPLVATTWRTPGRGGKVRTVPAIPAAFVRTVLALRGPSPPAIAQLTETPGNGSWLASEISTRSGGNSAPGAPIALFQLTMVI